MRTCTCGRVGVPSVEAWICQVCEGSCCPSCALVRDGTIVCLRCADRGPVYAQVLTHQFPIGRAR